MELIREKVNFTLLLDWKNRVRAIGLELNIAAIALVVGTKQDAR